jgi:hypothetical protein
MLHAGLDLSRRKVDVCLLSDRGEHLDQLAAPPDADALRTLARRIDEVHREPVCAVIESMTGARLVHDTLEQEGWDVEIADAQMRGLDRCARSTEHRLVNRGNRRRGNALRAVRMDSRLRQACVSDDSSSTPTARRLRGLSHGPSPT